MTRLEMFRKTSLGVALAAVLVAALNPATAQAGPLQPISDIETVADQQKADDLFKHELARLDSRATAVDTIEERLDARISDLDWLMSNYRAMQNEIEVVLDQAGTEMTPRERLGTVSDILRSHLRVIEASGIVIQAEALPGLEAANEPSQPISSGISGKGRDFLETLNERINEMAYVIEERSKMSAETAGTVASINEQVDRLAAFGSGASDDVEKAELALGEFTRLVEEPTAPRL